MKFKLPGAKPSRPAPKAPPKRNKVPPRPAPAEEEEVEEQEQPREVVQHRPYETTGRQVGIYDSPTPGRTALQAVCAKYGLHWGIVRLRMNAKGNGHPPEHGALVLVGTLLESEGRSTEDDALQDVADAIEEQYGGGA